ncbi:MAG: hypothetical protein V7786_01960 [Sulfitobacter litoralis]|uniref:hypothetical protein n=1 Tax=Sulfitobacter litoralis TaxID=335975 RepID=UPI003002BF06|tara:strand:- start:13835 stop:14014 length:180 start_codon:yes stop_codon:yes gene_type:complete
MTDRKLTPDELAAAVRDLIAQNGDCLTSLSFDTRDGGHDYEPITHHSVQDPVPTAHFVS